MVLAYHVIFRAYGFWLPNDPRGSWSTFVAAWELLLAGGKATKTRERESLASVEHDHESRLRAKAALKYPPVEFNGQQAHSAAMGFAQAIIEAGYATCACSVMPDHVHMVVKRHNRGIERIVGHLKSAATRRLDADGLHPFAETLKGDGRKQSPWAEGCWKVFLNSREEIQRATEYVEQNPIKDGKKRQHWSFVHPFSV